MAKLIKPNGNITVVSPASGQSFTLEELQGLVGGYIEVVTLHPNALFLVNEDGKSLELDANILATFLAHKRKAILPDDVIVGNVLLLTPEEMGN